MIFRRLNIEDLIEITPNLHEDNRGFFYESYRKDLLEKFINQKIDFCQENYSKSKKGVFRGLHYQLSPFEQTKLVSVIKGSIIDIAIDIRSNSENFLKNIQIELSEDNKKQLFIPKGFAHGFYVKSEEAIISYKVDTFYNKNSEIVINAMDPRLNLNLNKNKFIFSDRDLLAPNFDKIIF